MKKKVVNETVAKSFIPVPTEDEIQISKKIVVRLRNLPWDDLSDRDLECIILDEIMHHLEVPLGFEKGVE